MFSLEFSMHWVTKEKCAVDDHGFTVTLRRLSKYSVCYFNLGRVVFD